MKKYNHLLIDIVDGCNAKCEWCTTGIKVRGKGIVGYKMISVDHFVDGLDYILEKRIVEQTAPLGLFS